MRLHILAAGTPELAPMFIELGIVFVLLALLARLSSVFGLSPIPFFLITGLVMGSNPIYPLELSMPFIEIGAEIGVLLLLFMLGLEYTGRELTDNMRTGFSAGIVDIVLNFTPGFALGMILGWDWVVALLLGGVTYISSSGVISKLLSDTGWLGNRETPAILSLLVFEDLVMAIYLPLMTVLLLGAGVVSGLISLGIAMVAVLVLAAGAILLSNPITRVVEVPSNETLMLTILGLILLIGGLSQRLEVSAAVGAFMVGIALGHPLSERAHDLMQPIKDLFAAVFFVYFGTQITPSQLPPVLLIALGLAVVSGLTKLATGMYAARQRGVSLRGQFRAGTMLMIRGEFSIVIAGLGTAAGIANTELAPLTAAYVLIMALVGPLLIRVLNPVSLWLAKRRGNPNPTLTMTVPAVRVNQSADEA